MDPKNNIKICLFILSRTLPRRILVLLFLLFHSSCYVSRQAWHHGTLLSERRKVSEVLEDKDTKSDTRSKLAASRDIIEFARHQGLNVEDAYEYYIETPSPVVSYLVQAAFPDRLEFKTWWFPIVGSVPYLGFYDKEERDLLALELEQEGFDVKRGGASAFSSLGWFQDPIFSSMLARSEYSLAHLFFHELTHRTIWIPHSVEFNENLAEFIAYLLTKEYLTERKKLESLTQYEKHIRDKKKFAQWLNSLKEELHILYSNKLDTKTVLREKARIFKFYTIGPKKPQFEQSDFVHSEQQWNNAWVLASSMYNSNEEIFEKSYLCFQSKKKPIITFINELKIKVETAQSPDLALQNMCKKDPTLSAKEIFP